ncbi:MAG: MgtC/SapB family protein [Bdellovibrionales bacterium]|nr:MgtC/SapB family protein [Bdellovibrionales bacterium]
MDPFVSFPHTEVSLKLTLALGIGLLVGLERESASKDVGVRTFAITSLLGLAAQLIGGYFSLAGFAGILFLTLYMNTRSMLVNRSLEITTSGAMLVTFCMGVLVGQGHVFTPVASAILMTMLLAWKAELAAFAHGLRLEEIRSAVMLGLVTFVIYPILPTTYVDPWELVNPKEAWMTVIVLAGISFVNYVLLKVYSTKGLYYGALLGGAVNSSAAVTEISQSVRSPGGKILPHSLAILLMVTLAMYVRNLFILGLFEPGAIAIAFTPLVGMSVAAVYFINRARKLHEPGLDPTKPTNVSSPISLFRILKIGVIFLLLQAAGILGQRHLGAAGVLGISFLGGFASSASSTAAAAKLASQGKITDTVAGIATVLTSIASAFVNLPLVYQVTKDRALTRNLAFSTLACILSGLALMALVSWFQHWS